MNMIINHMSMDPIYEQIIAQIKAQIIDGTLEKELCSHRCARWRKT